MGMIVKRNTSGGFTLIELAVVIVIIGILMAALIPVYENYYDQTRIKKLEANMGNVRTAFADFIIDDPADPDDSTEVRYPRPARSNAATGSAGYGLEITAAEAAGIGTGSCSNGVCVAAGKNGRRVLIGAVPTRTLQIAGQYMSDTYGDRLTYAVTEDLTQANAMSTLTSDGAIRIVDEGGTVTSDAQFTLVSHGKNARGGFKANGQANGRACNGGKAGDGENCDNDATFRYAVGEVSTKTPEFYDDKAEFTLIENDDDQWWRETNPSGLNIVNRNTQSVGIGFPTGEPSQKLDVNGSIKARQDLLADLNVTAIKNVGGGTLTAVTDITAGQDINATRNLSAGNNLGVTHDASVGGNLAVTGTVTANGDITSYGNVAAVKNVGGDNVYAAKDVAAGANSYAKAFYYSGGPVVNGPGDPTPQGPQNLNCPAGSYLTGISGGNAVCSALPSGNDGQNGQNGQNGGTSPPANNGGTPILSNSFESAGCAAGFIPSHLPFGMGYMDDAISQEFANGAAGIGTDPNGFMSYIHYSGRPIINCQSVKNYRLVTTTRVGQDSCPSGYEFTNAYAGEVEVQGSDMPTYYYRRQLVCGLQ